MARFLSSDFSDWCISLWAPEQNVRDFQAWKKVTTNAISHLMMLFDVKYEADFSCDQIPKLILVVLHLVWRCNVSPHFIRFVWPWRMMELMDFQLDRPFQFPQKPVCQHNFFSAGHNFPLINFIPNFTSSNYSKW